MLFTVVRITADCADHNESVGTGFFFSSGSPENTTEYLVTNKHVIEDAASISFFMHGPASGSPEYVALGMQTRYTSDPADWILHPSPEVDLCCVPIKKLLTEDQRRAVFYLSIPSTSILSQEELDRCPASIGIAMIGYPNGLSDETNGLPIIRHGTTASHPAIPFDGRTEVAVDIACFPGSSGSPIMFSEPRYFASAQKFLGVLHAGPTITVDGKVLVTKIPMVAGRRTIIDTMMHLGFAISAARVQELAQLAYT
jgi:hypothetical protein